MGAPWSLYLKISTTECGLTLHVAGSEEAATGAGSTSKVSLLWRDGEGSRVPQRMLRGPEPRVCGDQRPHNPLPGLCGAPAPCNCVGKRPYPAFLTFNNMSDCQALC